MQHRALQYLADVREAIKLIQRIAQGMTLEQFMQNSTERLAVERLFEILGEAVSQLYRSDPPKAERITEYRRIISLRNILIHGYSQIDYDALWAIIQTDLEPLRREIQRLLDEEGKS